nr:hypothetical protein [uncultured Corynebacterium sp.]
MSAKVFTRTVLANNGSGYAADYALAGYFVVSFPAWDWPENLAIGTLIRGHYTRS